MYTVVSARVKHQRLRSRARRDVICGRREMSAGPPGDRKKRRVIRKMNVFPAVFIDIHYVADRFSEPSRRPVRKDVRFQSKPNETRSAVARCLSRPKQTSPAPVRRGRAVAVAISRSKCGIGAPVGAGGKKYI